MISTGFVDGEIKAGNFYYTRDANNRSVPLTKKDYRGLPNRSPHMLNAKIIYDNNKWFANVRASYRSKWIVFDKDGNGIYNKQDEYAKGFLQLNTSAGIQLKKGLKLQAGIDNLLNYVDATNLPNQPGINFFASVSYQFKK